MNKRGLSKVRDRINYTNKQSYKNFLEKNPNTKITYKQFVDILKLSNSKINNYILNNELGFKLPNNLGYIAVSKFKQKNTYKVIDWKNSNKLNKIIPLLNFHSFGNMYRIGLFKNSSLRALQAYKFNAHRLLKRELAKKIKSGKDYYELDRNFFSKRFKIDNYLKNI